MKLFVILFVCFVITTSAQKGGKKGKLKPTTTTTTTTEEPTEETTLAQQDNMVQAAYGEDSGETTMEITVITEPDKKAAGGDTSEATIDPATAGGDASVETTPQTTDAVTTETLAITTTEAMSSTLDEEEVDDMTTEDNKEMIAKVAKEMEKEKNKFSVSGLGGKLSSWIGADKKESSFYKVYNKMLGSLYQTTFKMAETQAKANKKNNIADQIGNATSKVMTEKQKKALQILGEETDNFWATVPIFKNMLGKTCFPDIGCFSAGEYQSITKRPIPLLPMSPDFIDMSFHLYTLESKRVPKNLTYNPTETDLKNSKFNPKLKTIIITHGYRSGFEDWMWQLKDFIFNETSDYNIVCAVWEKGSRVPMYQLAASNTRVVGALIAFFASTIVKTYKSYSNERFYLIGHSLGGHVVGYAGKRLTNPKVSRITGLDPAGPGFSFSNTTMHLTVTDGTLVDAIHTDVGAIFSEGLGTDRDFGYYDFYPNGGFFQPGCKPSRGIYNLIHAISTGEEISCSHTRAFRFAAMGSKHIDCQPIAYQCKDYGTYIEGRCTDCSDRKCMPMGLKPDFWLNHPPDYKTYKYRYYIQTAPIEDFCLYHYQLAVHTIKGSEPSTGYLGFYIKSTYNGQTKEAKFQRSMTRLDPMKIYTTLITFDYKLENVEYMSLQWKHYNSSTEKKRINKGSEIKIPILEFNFMSHLDAKVRREHSKTFCSKENISNLRISPNSQKHEYSECTIDLESRAIDLPSDMLSPLAAKEDMVTADHLNLYNLALKIDNSNYRNKTALSGYIPDKYWQIPDKAVQAMQGSG